MQLFYLSKNQDGYFKVRFVDQTTGKLLSAKSTHTKNKFEATRIAMRWLETGIPESHGNSRQSISVNSSSSGLDLTNLVKRLTDSEIDTLLTLIAQRRGQTVQPQAVLSAPQVSGNIVIAPEKAPDEAVPEKVLPKKIVLKNRRNKPKVRVVVKTENVEKINKESGRTPLINYMLSFWDYEKSQFVQEEIALGHKVTKSHCIEMQGVTKRYWDQYFGNEATAEDLNQEILEEFFFYLRNEMQLSGATVNKAMSCGSKAIKYLVAKKALSSNPFEGVRRFNPEEEKRGIPTEAEVAKLLNLKWENEAMYLGFRVITFCGLRPTELAGLKVCDIDATNDLIHVRNSWNEIDKLKDTKNTDERTLPIDHETAERLLRYARMNKYYSDVSPVLWTPARHNEPYRNDTYTREFYRMLELIGISEEQRKMRNICLYSMRHFFCTLVVSRAGLEKAQVLMGHRTQGETVHYSDHDSEAKFEAAKKMLNENINYVLSFKSA